MINCMYSIRDVKVGFMNPMVDLNDEVAKRNFSFAINNNDTLFFSPSDYDLYKVGEFDSDSGVFIPLSVPEFIISGSSVVGEKK